jgi:hypothetical protein
MSDLTLVNDLLALIPSDRDRVTAYQRLYAYGSIPDDPLEDGSPTVLFNALEDLSQYSPRCWVRPRASPEPAFASNIVGESERQPRIPDQDHRGMEILSLPHSTRPAGSRTLRDAYERSAVGMSEQPDTGLDPAGRVSQR